MYYVAHIVFLFCKSVYKVLKLEYYWSGKSRLIFVYSVLRGFLAHLQKMGLLLSQCFLFLINIIKFKKILSKCL